MSETTQKQPNNDALHLSESAPSTLFTLKSALQLFLAIRGSYISLEHALAEIIPSFTLSGCLPSLSPLREFIRRETEPGLTSKRGLDKTDPITLNPDGVLHTLTGG